MQPASPRAGKKAAGACGAGTGDGDNHYLVPLAKVEGYEGKPGSQQRCNLCNRKTSWVCATCTDGPFALFPVCPEVTTCRKGANRGNQCAHPCLGRHRCNPTFVKKKRKGGKRRRGGLGDDGGDDTDGSDGSEDPNAEDFGDDGDEDDD